MYLGIVFGITVKAKSSAFNTCIAFVSSMTLHKVMQQESELSEHPSYSKITSSLHKIYSIFGRRSRPPWKEVYIKQRNYKTILLFYDILVSYCGL